MAYPFGESSETGEEITTFEEFKKRREEQRQTVGTENASPVSSISTVAPPKTFDEFKKSRELSRLQEQSPISSTPSSISTPSIPKTFEEFKQMRNAPIAGQPSMPSMDIQPQVAPQQSEANRVKELSLYGGEQGQTESSIARRAIADPAIALLGKGVVGLGQGVVGLANLVPVPITDEAGRTTWQFGQAGKALEKIGYDAKTTQEIFDATLSPEARLAKKRVSEATGFVGTAKAAIENPSTIILSAIESIPSMLGGGAIGRTAMGITRGIVSKYPTLAPIVAAAIGEGAISAGSQAEQVRKAGEGITGKQAGISAGSGIATGILGLIGGKAASKLKIDDLDVLFASWQPQMKKTNILLKAVKGMVQEGLIEELPQSMQEQIASNLAQGRPWEEGVLEAGAMGALAGATTGGAVNTITGAFGRDTTPTPPPAQKTSAQINQEKVREQTGKVQQTADAIMDDNVTTDDLDNIIDETLAEFQAVPLETEAPITPTPTAPQAAVEAGLAPETNPVLATPERPVLISNQPQQQATEQEIQNAIQEQGAGNVLQRQPQEVGEAGSQRVGMEQVQQGVAPAAEGQGIPQAEVDNTLVTNLARPDLARQSLMTPEGFNVLFPEGQRQEAQFDEIVDTAISQLNMTINAQREQQKRIEQRRVEDQVNRRMSAEEKDRRYRDSLDRAYKITKIIERMDKFVGEVDQSFIDNNAEYFDKIEFAIKTNNPAMAKDAANVIERKAKNRAKQIRRRTMPIGVEQQQNTTQPQVEPRSTQSPIRQPSRGNAWAEIEQDMARDAESGLSQPVQTMADVPAQVAEQAQSPIEVPVQATETQVTPQAIEPSENDGRTVLTPEEESNSFEMATDYLLDDGQNAMKSTGYLLKAYAGLFRKSNSSIKRIAQKYFDEINARGLGNITDFAKSDLYGKIIEEIKAAVISEYGKRKEIDYIFSEIEKNPTGLTRRTGRKIRQIRDNVESQAVPQVESGGQVVSQPRELPVMPEVQTAQVQEAGAVRGVEEQASQAPVAQQTQAIPPTQASITRLSIPSAPITRQSQEELSKTLQKRIGKNADVRVNDDGTIDIVSKKNQTVINVRQMSPTQDGVVGKWSQEGGRNTIHIAENGEISHELTHAMRDLGMITNNEWSRLVAIAKKNMGDKAESIRTRYKEAGVELSEGDLDHELVASYINDVANGKIDPAANRALTQKVIDFFKELARSIGYGVGSDVGVVGRTVAGEGISSATKTDSNVGRMSIPTKPTGMFQDIATARVEQNEESGKWEIRDDRNVLRSGFNTKSGAQTYKDVLSGKYATASVRSYTDKNGEAKYGILMNGELGVEPERMEKVRWFKKGFESQEDAAIELAKRESRIMDSASQLVGEGVENVAQIADARKNLVTALLGQNVERAQINDLLGTLFRRMKIAPATQMKIVKQMKNVSLSAIKKNPASSIQKAWDFVDNVVMQSYAEEKANVEHKAAVRGFKKALAAIKKIGLSEENIWRKKLFLDGLDLDNIKGTDLSYIIEEIRKDDTIEKTPEDIEYLNSLSNGRSVADMTADEINYITENLNLIRKDQVELRKSIESAAEEAVHKDRKQVIEEQKFNPYKREPIQRGSLFKKYLAFFLPSRTVARIIDGKKDGIIHKYFVDAWRKAENVSYKIMLDARDLITGMAGDFDVNKMSRPTEQNKIPKSQQGTPTEYILDRPYVEYNKDGTVKTSSEQKVSLYDGEKVAIALAGRNEANRRHMREGGIVLPDLTHMDAIKLTDADIDRITQDVENDPQLKKIADAYDELFNTLLKSYLNETSMKLHGIKIADVENYFPIIVSKAHAMFKDIDWENPDPLQVSNLNRFVIESIGAFKARIPNAKNAVVLYDVFKMGDRAITLTGLYSGYAEPIANVKRLMRTEFKRMQDGEPRRIGSVPDAIKQQHGEAMWDRISSLAGEVEKTRNIRNRDDSFLSKALNVWTRGALAWNLPVILTQPTSYLQALAEMPMKYWARAIATRPATWDEMKKGSVRLKMRADGRISIAMGAVRGMSTKGIGETGMKPITEFDRQAVGRIWNGVKMMMEDRYPDASPEEIIRRTGEETDRIVDLTQSTFEQSSRSAAQRSNSMFWKSTMRFSSQNTKNFDMLVNAVLDFGEGKNLKTFTKMAQKMAVLFAAQVVYAALKTGVARKLMRRGDEEEDEKYFNETLVSSLASLGGIGTEIMLKILNASRYQGGRGDPFYDAITQSGGLMKDAVTGMWKAKTGTEEERKKADKSLVKISENSLRQLGVMTGTGMHSLLEPGLAIIRHMDAEKKRFDAVKTGIQNNAGSYAPSPYKPTTYKQKSPSEK